MAVLGNAYRGPAAGPIRVRVGFRVRAMLAGTPPLPWLISKMVLHVSLSPVWGGIPFFLSFENGLVDTILLLYLLNQHQQKVTAISRFIMSRVIYYELSPSKNDKSDTSWVYSK